MQSSHIIEQVLRDFKKRRKRLGLTQPMMDKKLFYAKGNYGRVERGEVGITIDKLQSIAKVLFLEVRITFSEFTNKL